METNYEKLDTLLESHKGTLEEIYKLQREVQEKKEVIFKAIGDLSETFTEEAQYDHEDELNDKLYEISSNLDVVHTGHYNSFMEWDIGERIEFWVPSTC